jgi:hypothetical protein
VILGAQDGLVNVLGISVGLSAAGANTFIILAAGLAATITESISMGAVAYTSSIAERDRYLSEQACERREMRDDPEAEREEIRQIYEAKGFRGELLTNVVDMTTSSPGPWLATMMSEELHLEPVDNPFCVANVDHRRHRRSHGLADPAVPDDPGTVTTGYPGHRV